MLAKAHQPKVKHYPGYLRRPKKTAKKRTIFIFLAIFLLALPAVTLFSWLNLTNNYINFNYSLNIKPLPLMAAQNAGDVVIPINYHIVRAGDNLNTLAAAFKITPQQLAQLNNLNSRHLKAGAVLILPQQAAVTGQSYVVQRGDTLSSISVRFAVPQSNLVMLNNLDSLELSRRQLLQLTANHPLNYVAKAGDSLESIADRFELTVDQLMQYNALNTTEIIAGTELILFNPVFMVFNDEVWQPQANRELWQARVPPPAQMVPANFLPANPVLRPESQPLPFDGRSDNLTVQQRFTMAQTLLTGFNRQIEQAGMLSNVLQGYTIVLDSGHGGRDPGAVVTKEVSGEVKTFYEAQYNYDVAMRLYALLKRHGAQVQLTNISPSYTIRNNDIQQTFANTQNAVFNNEREGDSMGGGLWVLRRRLEITGNLLKNITLDRRIFISIHNDSSPHTPLGLVAVASNPTQHSLNLAQAIIDSKGRGTIRRGSFIMVNNNPAPAAVLVEVRNLVQEDFELVNSYLVRQQDAEKIAQGIINYVAAKN